MKKDSFCKRYTELRIEVSKAKTYSDVLRVVPKIDLEIERALDAEDKCVPYLNRIAGDAWAKVSEDSHIMTSFAAHYYGEAYCRSYMDEKMNVYFKEDLGRLWWLWSLRHADMLRSYDIRPADAANAYCWLRWRSDLPPWYIYEKSMKYVDEIINGYEVTIPGWKCTLTLGK